MSLVMSSCARWVRRIGLQGEATAQRPRGAQAERLGVRIGDTLVSVNGSACPAALRAFQNWRRNE